MSNKFPSLPAPRFAPQKPSPLSKQQSGTGTPPVKEQPKNSSTNQPSSSTTTTTTTTTTTPATTTTTNSNNLANSSSINNNNKKKKKKLPTPASIPDSSGPGKQFATQIFKLVDALKANGGPMNLSDLEAVTGVRGLLSEHTDTPFNQELFDSFNAHDRVNVTERGMVKLWSYRPDYSINNPQQVLELLQRFSSRGGMPINTLKQSWPNVMSAITELENEGKVLVFRTEGNAGKEEVAKTAFYDELGCKEKLGASHGALDEEFREMWHSLETPPAHSLPQELQEAGLSSSSSSVIRPLVSQKKSKKKGKGGKVKITNTHLKDLGIDLSKDYVPGGSSKS